MTCLLAGPRLLNPELRATRLFRVISVLANDRNTAISKLDVLDVMFTASPGSMLATLVVPKDVLLAVGAMASFFACTPVPRLVAEF